MNLPEAFYNKRNKIDDDEHVINCTTYWISSVVIKHNFCPFASRAFNNIHFNVCRDKRPIATLKALKDLIKYLEHHRTIETAFIIFPESFSDFGSYLSLVAQAEDLLKKDKFSDRYQLASFHNDYCFHGLQPDDAANYTNRSPFPMIHVLRVKSVSKAIEHFGDTDKIPERNVAYARGKGKEFMKELLDKCR